MRKPARHYQVAVPSYQRAELVDTTTLHLLASRGVDPARITLFVDSADPQQGRYHALAHDRGLAGVHVVHTRGIQAARRAIAAYYPPGTPVVTLDDDVTDIVRAVSPKRLEPVTELDRWLRQAFTITAGADLYVWGVNAVVNPFWMDPKGGPSTGLKFLIGTCWGFYSRPGHPLHDTTVEVKEDYDTSLRAWWYDGGAVRFDDVAVRADHYRAPGGCQEYRTLAASEEAADALLRTWPGLVRRNTNRASGHAEILLTPRKRHGGHPTTKPPPGLARARAAQHR